MKELLFKINDNDIMLSRLKKITVFKICVLVFLKKMKYLQIKKIYYWENTPLWHWKGYWILLKSISCILFYWFKFEINQRSLAFTKFISTLSVKYKV